MIVCIPMHIIQHSHTHTHIHICTYVSALLFRVVLKLLLRPLKGQDESTFVYGTAATAIIFSFRKRKATCV